MRIIADLHLHSKYSRAVSPQMILPTIAQWAEKKGIGLVGTGDFTHPMWFRELKDGLKEAGNGIYQVKNTKFLLTTEVSCIYSDKGKGRRVHLLIIFPKLSDVEKFNKDLALNGANLFSDGRPIMGLSVKRVAQIALNINPEVILIPAHCLLPGTLVHTDTGVRQIEKIRVGEKVLTHCGGFERISHIYQRLFEGKVIRIRPWYFSLGLTTTFEHPFFALKPEKHCSWIGGLCKPNSVASGKHKCRAKHFEKYRPCWVPAEELSPGDVLIYPRSRKVQLAKKLDLGERVLGKNNRNLPRKILTTEGFCRLAGYYLAEGYLGNNSVCFSFSEKESEYINEVKCLMKDIFGMTYCRYYRRKKTRSEGVELMFFSTVLANLFRRLFYDKSGSKRANNKKLPDWALFLPEILQKEILVGWWRGDAGYTSSAVLANQMKMLCLRLGIVPSILKDSKEGYFKRGNHRLGERQVRANFDSYYFSHLAFFEDNFSLLRDPVFIRFRRKLNRRHGWIDKNYIYLPIRKIEKTFYKGKVHNLEVEKDNSYVTEFAAVHNCWTPWFGIYGANSGYDSLDEAFEDLAKHVPAVETGLSSDPAMNWRMEELANRQIVSFSDAHSPAKIGREATVFEIENLSFEEIRKLKIASTIEFYPEEGKYHFTGHRKCNVIYSPNEARKKGTICPVCGRALTPGVMSRVESLGKNEIQTETEKDKFGVRWIFPKGRNRPGYVMIVPLLEILAEAYGVGVGSQKAINNYQLIINNCGSEFKILLETPIEKIQKVAGEKVAEAIAKVRSGDIAIEPGYDGVFGKVRVWPASAKATAGKPVLSQPSLF